MEVSSNLTGCIFVLLSYGIIFFKPSRYDLVMRLENRKCTTKQRKKEWVEICDIIVRNRLNEI